MLNLSKNKISVIEGLRELTRLRVLDLSCNRISRIGHGMQLVSMFFCVRYSMYVLYSFIFSILLTVIMIILHSTFLNPKS